MPALGELLIAKMAHRGKEQCQPTPMLRDVAGFFLDLHLQHDIACLIETVECRGLIVKLITQYGDKVACLAPGRHGFGSSRTIASTRAPASRSRAGMAAVSGMLRQYFFG